MPRSYPKKKLKLINIGIKQDNKELKFGMLIIAYVRSGLVALLQNYADVFAWLYANMYGLDTKIMVCVCVYVLEGWFTDDYDTLCVVYV